MIAAPDVFLSYNREDQARTKGENGPSIATGEICYKCLGIGVDCPAGYKSPNA